MTRTESNENAQDSVMPDKSSSVPPYPEGLRPQDGEERAEMSYMNRQFLEIVTELPPASRPDRLHASLERHGSEGTIERRLSDFGYNSDPLLVSLYHDICHEFRSVLSYRAMNHLYWRLRCHVETLQELRDLLMYCLEISAGREVEKPPILVKVRREMPIVDEHTAIARCGNTATARRLSVPYYITEHVFIVTVTFAALSSLYWIVKRLVWPALVQVLPHLVQLVEFWGNSYGVLEGLCYLAGTLTLALILYVGATTQ